MNNRQINLLSFLQNILGGGSQAPQGPPSGPPFPNGGGPPPGPPPKFTPQQTGSMLQAGIVGGPEAGFGTYAVDPGAIRPCIGRYVYIWLRGGYSFWAWLTFVGQQSVAGYRWTGYRWVYFGIDRRLIVSFICY